jgi:anti-sigma factor RsiW
MSDIEPKCREVRPHLSAYIDGEIEEPLARRVAAHTEACPDCREDLAALREPGERVLTAFASLHAPPGAALSVLRRIEIAGVPLPASRIAVIVLEAACAAAAVLLAALVFALTATERPARAGAPDLQRILGQPAETVPENGTAAPRSEADLLATILEDPREIVYVDDRGRSR